MNDDVLPDAGRGRRACCVPLAFDLDAVRGLFTRQAAQFVEAVQVMHDLDLLDPSACRGWSRLDLVEHVRAGLDEMAGGAAVATDAEPDHDAASYWVTPPDDRDQDPVPHLMWLRRTASAYSRPTAAVRHLEDAAERASCAVARMPEGRVRFQGKVLTAGDFVATWVTELAVHQLDLQVGGAPVGSDVARRTLEALAGTPLPAGLDAVTAVRVGLGRVPWPVGETRDDRFPIRL